MYWEGCGYPRAIPGATRAVADNVADSVASLLAQARENQQKLDRLRDFELGLLQAESLADLAGLLTTGLPATFDLLGCRLLLVDPAEEFEAMLRSASHPGLDGIELIDDEDEITRLARLGPDPLVTAYDADEHDWLYPHSPLPAGLAILPLRRHDECQGVLTCASADPERYHESMGTDLLRPLAAILAITVENLRNTHRLQQISLTDPLTGIGNRRFFDQRLEEECARAVRNGRPLVMLLVDIDHFKQVNDAHGHAIGDNVLRAVATRIRAELRTADILARYGGEEFTVLLPDTQITPALDIAERIRAVVESTGTDLFGNPIPPVTVSIGIASVEELLTEPDPLQLATHLEATADASMYRAKQSGRNRVEHD